MFFFLEVVIVLYCFLIPFIFHWFSQCFLNCPAVLWSHLSGLVWPEPQPEAEGETFVWQNSSSSPSVSTWFCEGWVGVGGGCAVTVNLPDRNLTRQTENRLKVFSLFLLFLRADTHGCKHWICYVLVRVSLRGGSNRQPFNPVVPNKKTKKQIQMWRGLTQLNWTLSVQRLYVDYIYIFTYIFLFKCIFICG